MACELTATVKSATTAWPPQIDDRRRNGRSVSERLTTLSIIAAIHVLAVVAIWTRHVMVEQEPAPLQVNLVETAVPEQPPPPPVIVPKLSVPPVVLAPPLPPAIEVPAEAPSAILAKELPVDSPAPPPVVVTSNVTEARFDVDYLNNPKPVYPALSRRLREEGVVVLKVLVRADGSVANAVINTRSGSQRLDEAALSAVKQWHFVPARRGSESIESWVLVPIEFELKS